MLIHDKMQHNSSFSFQNSAERLVETPEMNTERGEKTKKSRFFQDFQTPDKPLSEISDKSQRKMNRSIFEGLKFIHQKDENQTELEQIKEMEKRSTSVNKEEILSHVLENKTRVKKKLAYYRDNFKRQKKQEELKPKAQYHNLRESSLKKMKGILSNTSSAVKKHK